MVFLLGSRICQFLRVLPFPFVAADLEGKIKEEKYDYFLFEPEVNGFPFGISELPVLHGFVIRTRCCGSGREDREEEVRILPISSQGIKEINNNSSSTSFPHLWKMPQLILSDL